jgi:hypothetical protein
MFRLGNALQQKEMTYGELLVMEVAQLSDGLVIHQIELIEVCLKVLLLLADLRQEGLARTLDNGWRRQTYLFVLRVPSLPKFRLRYTICNMKRISNTPHVTDQLYLLCSRRLSSCQCILMSSCSDHATHATHPFLFSHPGDDSSNSLARGFLALPAFISDHYHGLFQERSLRHY